MARHVAALVLGVAMVMSAGSTPITAQAGSDRACLQRMLDQYLAAVITHDPAAAPLVVGFRQTENAHRRGSAGGARLCRVHPAAGLAHAAQCVQRVVRHRRSEDPDDLRGDVLSAAGARRAELATL
jgi:anaerobic glycerol-3-phosphate dehydrogenase